MDLVWIEFKGLNNPLYMDWNDILNIEPNIDNKAKLMDSIWIEFKYE
jgi:hypothetical protein